MTDRRLRWIAVVPAVVGLLSAAYLTYTKLFEGGECGVSAGCSAVQTSSWSEIAGVPVSLVGVLGYVAILVALFALRGELGRGAAMAFSIVGLLVSAYLMYRAIVTLEQFCPFCTTSAVCMLLLAILTTWRYLRGGDPSPPAPAPAA